MYTSQAYLDPGYRYDIGYVADGGWQAYDLDVTSTDDYDILALVYSHTNDFDLYVVDPNTGATITSATVPYNTENGLDYIWAVSTLKAGKYSVYIHSTTGAGDFAFIHFYNRQPIQKTVGTTTTTKTVAPTTTVTPTHSDSVRSDPAVWFTNIPARSSSDVYLSGGVAGVQFSQYRVTLYVRVRGNWWGPKPYWTSPLTTIAEDGSWRTRFVAGGVDEETTEVAAFLVPASYDPPDLSGASSLPQQLFQYSYAEESRL